VGQCLEFVSFTAVIFTLRVLRSEPSALCWEAEPRAGICTTICRLCSIKDCFNRKHNYSLEKYVPVQRKWKSVAKKVMLKPSHKSVDKRTAQKLMKCSTPFRMPEWMDVRTGRWSGELASGQGAR
jgi:hypothetical protein